MMFLVVLVPLCCKVSTRRASLAWAHSNLVPMCPVRTSLTWCPGRDLNPHSACAKKDFKSFASADFATRAAKLKSLASKGDLASIIVDVELAPRTPFAFCIRAMALRLAKFAQNATLSRGQIIRAPCPSSFRNENSQKTATGVQFLAIAPLHLGCTPL